MEVIDAHIHPFIDSVNNIAVFGAPTTLEEYMAELKRANISMACGAVIMKTEAKTFEDIVKLNNDALEIRKRYPDFYIPGVHVHSRFPKESCRELERLHKLGVRWIGELVPYMMKTGTFAEPGMMDIYATAQELDMPINLHLYPSPLSEMETVTNKFPRLKLIMAHPGDFWEAPERFEFVAKHENVYLDISGNGLYRWNMLRHAIDICGSEKLLFGSDFPICSAAMNLQGALAEHLSDAEFDNVLCKNFKRLVGMD